MGNCCKNELPDGDKRGQLDIQVVDRSSGAARGPSLKPENAEAVREKYRRWIEDKQAIIVKN